MKVMSVFGTRPEAIKMAPLVKKLNADPDIESVLCVTAQHREMLDQVLELFELKPDYDLNIMKPNQTLAMITANVLTGIDECVGKAVVKRSPYKFFTVIHHAEALTVHVVHECKVKC